MIRKYHNHTLQTNLRHSVEEPHNNNNHKTPGRQSKPTSSLFPIKMIAKLEMTQRIIQQKHGTNTEPHNGSNNQRGIDNSRSAALE